VLQVEIGVVECDLGMLLLQIHEQPAIGGCDLLGVNQAVHQLVEAVRGQHQLDVVERAVTVDVAQPLIQKLIPHAHLGL
jgi:hypothetical protein